MASSSVTKQINCVATPDQVWQAITDATWLAAWMSDVALTFEVGHAPGEPFVIRGKHTRAHDAHGKIIAYHKPRTFAYTSMAHVSALPDIPENYSVVTFEMAASAPGHCHLSVTHSNLIAPAAWEHANFYWPSALMVLKNMLEQKNHESLLRSAAI